MSSFNRSFWRRASIALGCVALWQSPARADNVGPDVAPETTVYVTGNGTVALNGSTSFRTMGRELNGSYLAIHIDITKPDGTVVPFAYYGVTGADSREYTLGNGVQGFYLNQTGTYTIVTKAADYTLGYERWGTPQTSQVVVQNSVTTRTFYISSSRGNDGNAGTSPSAPWASLSKINTLQAGDTVRLRDGDQWLLGSDLTINASGNSAARLVISDYYDGTFAPPVISRSSSPNPSSGTCFIIAGDYVTVNNLTFTNSFFGVKVNDNRSGIEVTSCTFKNMNYLDPNYGTATDEWAGFGLSVGGGATRVGVNMCYFDTCFGGIRAAGSAMSLTNSTAVGSGCWGIALTAASNVVVSGFTIGSTGLNVLPHPGAAAIYTTESSKVAIVQSNITSVFHYGTQADGSAIAIENHGPYRSDYVLVSDCQMYNSEGPAISWLGDTSGYYNIIQNNYIDNCNTRDNAWLSVGVPASFARATFMSFNTLASQTLGGAFINNTRANTPAGNTGRYGADWNGSGIRRDASGFSISGASD